MFRLYRAILKATGRTQIILILLALGISALAPVPLKFHKDIVNGLTDAKLAVPDMIRLAALMGAAIMASLVLTWILGLVSNRLGEDMVRRMRRASYHAARDGKHLKMDSGTLSTAITTEVEDLGHFFGNAISTPLVQLGTLVSVIGFVTATQPELGLIAMAVVLPQIAVVLFSQIRVNELIGQRLTRLRAVTTSMAHEHTHENQQSIHADFDSIFRTRMRMYVWKYSARFGVGTVNTAGLIAVVLFGGILVINGKSDLGSVVASSIGLARVQGPIGSLIAFYQNASSKVVNYDMLVDVAGDPVEA